MTELLPDGRYPLLWANDQETGERRDFYALQPKQLECFNLTPLADPDSPYEHIGYGGAAYGGKSYLARTIGVYAAIIWPGCRVAIIRETEGDVRKNHINEMVIELPEEVNGQPVWHLVGTEARFANGSLIDFTYLNKDKDLNRFQGPAYDIFVFEEATLYDPKWLNWLTGNRMRSSVDGTQPFALYPSNPGHRGHAWYKRVFVDRLFEGRENPEKYTFVQAKVRDNVVGLARDPGYLDRLETMDEPYRSWQLEGDWNAGMGMALSEVNVVKHLVQTFAPPLHWPRFGSFDWGYGHPFSFGWYTVDEDGQLYKIETVTGRRLRNPEIIDRIRSTLGLEELGRLQYTTAGHDCWAKHRVLDDNTPTIAEDFEAGGIILAQANIDRQLGLKELRHRLAWKGVGPKLDGQPTDGVPRLLFFDTENNRKCIRQLSEMPTDPSNVEDALKVDADDFGRGGDDMYDETRYAVTSRPTRATKPGDYHGAFDPEVLAAEAERMHKSSTFDGAVQVNRRLPTHGGQPTFNEVY